MKRLFTLLLLLPLGWINAQDVTIQGKSMPPDPIYSSKYSSYDLFEIDVEEARKSISTSLRTGVEIDLVLGTEAHKFQVFKYNLFRPDSKIRAITSQGVIDVDHDPSLENYRGYNANFGGREVAITVGKNYLSILFIEGEETYYLEQVPFDVPNYNKNHFILYTNKSYKSSGLMKNLAEESSEIHSHQEKIDTVRLKNLERNAKCYEATIGMVADFSFFARYGKDRNNVDARFTTIVNQMQMDWVVPKLLYDYIWGIGPVAVFEDSLRDPFLNSNSAAALKATLGNIAPNILIGGFVIATAWSAKPIKSPFYAVTQNGGCTLDPYAACIEFNTNNGIVRNLLSHTIGHAIGGVHDPGGSPYIMSPDIVGNSIWSAVSQINILDRTNVIAGCLVDCSGGRIPVAEFSADPVEGCVPLIVQFTNMSTNGVSYKWSFPGGIPSSSTQKDPIIIYTNPGAFNVELEVQNPKCTTKVEKIAFMLPRDKPRQVSFTSYSDPNSNEVEFTAYADRADIFRWKFPDGTSDEGQIVYHTFPKEGTFEVELCVSNDCGETCRKQKFDNYYIPLADFEIDTNRGCAPKTIKFFDRSTSNAIAWTWSFPGGTPNGSFVQNPTVKYTRPGKYSVKLTVNSKKNNAFIMKDTIITIDSLPLAQFDPTVAGPLVSMNNSSLYVVTHFWDFGDGTTSKDSSPVHVFRDGRYTISYTASNACGKTIVKRTVTVGNKPTAGFSVQKQNGCVPYTVKFQNTSTSSAQSFEWTFQGGSPATSTDKEPTVTYNSIGQFDVKLVAKSGPESDSLTQTKFITVGEGPTAEFQQSVTGFVAYFTDLSKKVTNYYWDFGDGKSSTQASPNHNYGVEGEFKVRLITENECGIDTFERDIAIYLIPKVNFSSNLIKGCSPLTVQFNDLSSIDVSEWSWQFESGVPAVSTLKNPIVTFNKAGKYTVKLAVKNSNGTNSATKLKYIEVLSPIKCPRKPQKKTENGTGNDQFNDPNLFSRSRTEYTVEVFPNPVKDELVILAKEGTVCSLITMTGQVLKQQVQKTYHSKIDVSDLQEGCYLLKVNHEDYNEVIKLFIEK